MGLIDSHAHLTADSVFEEIEPILQRAQAVKIESIINICTNLKTLERGIALREKYPWIYNAAATTPHDVDGEGELVFDSIAKCARAKNLVAIGETGLDYYYEHSQRVNQQNFLRRYLRLAVECDLPVVIHCRDAFADFFHILDEETKLAGRPIRGVLHCFTGTIEEAKEVLTRQWYLSLSGIVTFKKSEQLRQVAQMVPLELLLIETDTPYLAPQRYRSQRNEPAYLLETAKLIADLKGVSLETLMQITSQNARTLFKIS